jgi:DNA-nicking Smr family endonuclease
MTRKKSNDRPSPEFKNNPFKSLKSISPCPPAVRETTKSVRIRTHDHAEDADLFIRETTGVRRLHRTEESDAALTHAAGAPEQSPVQPAKEENLFLQAMRSLGAVASCGERAEDEPTGEQRRSQSNRMKQLKRGALRISREIDLHGFLRDEALARLERFIRSAYEQDARVVLVITGKGLNSPEGPVLQGAAANWLHSKGRNMVAEFAPAPRDKGGSGAFVVFVKKREK